MHVNAQSLTTTNDSLNIKLSENEFKLLKEDYEMMLNSKTYDLLRRKRREMGKKKNGLKFPNPKEDKIWFIDKDYTKKWLALHLNGTKFGSVDEAYNLYEEMFELTRKQMEENASVYQLLSKTSKKQSKEIFDMEVKWNQANLLE